MLSLIFSLLIVLLHGLVWVNAIRSDHSRMDDEARSRLLKTLKRGSIVSLIFVAINWLTLQGFWPAAEDDTKLLVRLCIVAMFADAVALLMVRSWLRKKFEQVKHDPEPKIYHRNDIWRKRS